MPQTERLELHRSAPQHLVLRNGSDRPAFIEPFEETAPTLRLDPASGGAFFVVATLAEAEPVPGQPWRALAPDTETNVALIEPGGYLQESGPDLVLRVGFRGGPGAPLLAGVRRRRLGDRAGAAARARGRPGAAAARRSAGADLP